MVSPAGRGPTCDDKGQLSEKLRSSSYTSFSLENGIKVYIYSADITQLPMDVIVNAANSKLQHIGGVAAAIARKAGPSLVKESEDLIKKYGMVHMSENVVTTGGSLCSSIIHAVGPQWKEHPPDQCRYFLELTLKRIFQTFLQLNERSIAIPTISTGIYGVPLSMAVAAFHDTLQWLGKQECDRHLEVHLVDKDIRAVNALEALASPYKS